MELKDEEIKKALEEFQNRILKTNLSYHIFESEMMAVVNALDLINRQQTEIEKFKNEIKEADQVFSEGSFYDGLAIVARLAKEIERGGAKCMKHR